MAESSFTGREYTIYRSADGKVGTTTAKIPALGPKDILVRITHSGVCHTDLLFCGLGAQVALGHEGVGIVEAIGSDVTQFKVGERAAGGYHRGSCGTCKYCLTGNDIYCYNRVIFGEGEFDNGTFSPYYIGKETYLHRVPDGMASEHAAPLQCAGATVYSALRETVKPTDRVGILGIGGLGHLAIQFANKLGAKVVVFSSSAEKESEARELGASEFYLASEMNKITAPLEVLVICGARNPDWDVVLNKKFLARKGTIVPLAAPVTGPFVLDASPIFWDTYNLHSSLVASRAMHDEMMEFADCYDIKPIVQVSKVDGPESIQKIFEDLQSNKVRYRAVIEY